MNDPRELHDGEELVRKIAERTVGEFPEASSQWKLIKSFIENESSLRLSETCHVFLASLSAVEDHLPQWRAYDCDGAGFAIGFKSLPLLKDEAMGDVVLIKCEYDQDAFKQRIQRIFTEVAAGFEKFVQSRGNTSEDEKVIYQGALQALFIRIHSEIPRLKNDFFREEQEWRIVATPLQNQVKGRAKFRPCRCGLRPYVEIHVARPDGLLDLADIIVGPGQDAQRSRTAAAMFLEQCGYNSKELLKSSAGSYRGGTT